MEDILIRVYSGESIEDKCRTQKHPLNEVKRAKEIIDLYDSPRDTGVQLHKFLLVIAEHRRQLEEQMADLEANLDELREHEEEALQLLAKLEKNQS